jgi:hypothetical protein
VKTKPLKGILHTLYLRMAFYIATDFSGTLDFTTCLAFDRSHYAAPCGAPVGDSAGRVNLAVFTCWKDKMFGRAWETVLPSIGVLHERVA